MAQYGPGSIDPQPEGPSNVGGIECSQSESESKKKDSTPSNVNSLLLAEPNTEVSPLIPAINSSKDTSDGDDDPAMSSFTIVSTVSGGGEIRACRSSTQ